MSQVNNPLPTTAPTTSPSTPEEYYAQWVDQYGVDAEKIRDEGLTAVQRAYDRSSASYGATAEMLRQSGLNNSGLAGLYQNMAETNRRQGNATVYDQYAANVKANKTAFAKQNNEIIGKIYESALTMPEGTKKDLEAIAAMYGVDPITASQMAQNAWDSTADVRTRYEEGKYNTAYNQAFSYIDEIASKGGVLNADAISKLFPDLGESGLGIIQSIIDERKGNYSNVYANASAQSIYDDLLNGTLDASILAGVIDEEQKQKLIDTYGIPDGEFENVISDAKTAYEEYTESEAAEDTQKVQNVTDKLVSMYADGFDFSGITQSFVQNMYGLTEDQAEQVISNFNTITGESIGGGSTGTTDGFTFTGTDGNDHTVSEDIAVVYNDLVENFGKTGQEAIEYIKDNNGEGQKYNFSEEDIAGLDAYGVYAQAETDKAVTTFSDAVNDFVNVALNGGDFTSSLMAIRDLDPNLYASLNTADFKNEDGTWNTDKVLTGLFDYAKQDGNADLINNIGNAAVRYDISSIKNGTADGKTVFEALTAIARGDYSDGSKEAVDEQLKYVLENAVDITSSDMRVVKRHDPHDSSSHTKTSYVDVGLSIGGEETRVTLTVDDSVTAYQFEGGKNGDFATPNGKDLYIKQDGKWYAVSYFNGKMPKEDWEKLKKSLLIVSYRPVKQLGTVNPAIVDAYSNPSEATLNGTPFNVTVADFYSQNTERKNESPSEKYKASNGIKFKNFK